VIKFLRHRYLVPVVQNGDLVSILQESFSKVVSNESCKSKVMFAGGQGLLLPNFSDRHVAQCSELFHQKSGPVLGLWKHYC
jgi:hypothetical protein